MAEYNFGFHIPFNVSVCALAIQCALGTTAGRSSGDSKFIAMLSSLFTFSYDNHLEFVTHFLNNLNLKCSYTSNEDFFFYCHRWMDTIQIGDGQYCSRLRSLLNLSKLWCKIAMDVISMSLPNVHLIIWFNGYVQLQYGQPNCIIQSITPMIGIFLEKKIT